MKNPCQDLLEFAEKFGKEKEFFTPPFEEKIIGETIANIFVKNSKVVRCDVVPNEDRAKKDRARFVPCCPPRSGTTAYKVVNQFYDFSKYLLGRSKEYFLAEIQLCEKETGNVKAREIYSAISEYNFEAVEGFDKAHSFFIYYEDDPYPVFEDPKIKQWILDRKERHDPDARTITCSVTGNIVSQKLPLRQIPPNSMYGQTKGLSLFTDNMAGGENSIVAYNGYYSDSDSGSSQREKSCSVDYSVNEKILSAILYLCRNQRIRTRFENTTNIVCFSNEDDHNFDPNDFMTSLEDIDGEAQEGSQNLPKEIVSVLNGNAKNEKFWSSDSELMFLTMIPNAARLSLGNYSSLKVSEFCNHLLDHYQFFSTKNKDDKVRVTPVWKLKILEFDTEAILGDLDSCQKRLSALKEERWIWAVLFGEEYPVNLDTLVSKYITDCISGRICKTTKDWADKKKSKSTFINQERIALIKAILNRKFHIKEKEMKETDAYKLGVLFALFEHSQKIFHGKKISRGIISQMRTASRAPVAVYPDMYLKYKQVYYTSVVNSGGPDAGLMISLGKKIEALMEEIACFPAQLRKQSDRASWVMGYNDANSIIYKKEKDEKDDEQSAPE